MGEIRCNAADTTSLRLNRLEMDPKKPYIDGAFPGLVEVERK